VRHEPELDYSRKSLERDRCTRDAPQQSYVERDTPDSVRPSPPGQEETPFGIQVTNRNDARLARENESTVLSALKHEFLAYERDITDLITFQMRQADNFSVVSIPCGRLFSTSRRIFRS
jgi:hypothetical protein